MTQQPSSGRPSANIAYQNDPASFFNDPMIKKFLDFGEEHRRLVRAEQLRIDGWEQWLQTEPVHSASAYHPPSNVSSRKDPADKSLPVVAREILAQHAHDQRVPAMSDVPARCVAGSELRFVHYVGSHSARDASGAWDLGVITKETRQNEENKSRRDGTKKRHREEGGEDSPAAVRVDESELQDAESACLFPWKKQKTAHEQPYVRTSKGKFQVQSEPGAQTWQPQQNDVNARSDAARPGCEREHTPNESAVVAPRPKSASTSNQTARTPLLDRLENCDSTSSIGLGA